MLQSEGCLKHLQGNPKARLGLCAEYEDLGSPGASVDR